MVWAVTIGSGVLFVALMVILGIVSGFFIYAVIDSLRDDSFIFTRGDAVPIGLVSLLCGSIAIFCVVERGQRVTLLSGDWWVPLLCIGGLVLIFIISYSLAHPSSRSNHVYGISNNPIIRDVIARRDEELEREYRKRRNITLKKWSVGILVLFALWAFGMWASKWSDQYLLRQAAEEAIKAKNRIYVQRVVCDNAWGHPLDFSNVHKNRIEIDLTYACFSSPVHLPKHWNSWSFQHAPDNPERAGWVSFWDGGNNASNPMPLDDNGSASQYCRGGCYYPFRLEGRGKILFYAVWCGGNSCGDDKPTKQEQSEAKQQQEPAPETEKRPQHEQSSPPGSSQRRSDVVVTLGTCKLAGDYLVCDIEVTNRGEEREIQISADDSRVIDSTGHEHHPVKLEFGEKKCSGGCWVGNRLPADVKFAASIAFEHLPIESTELALLQIGKMQFYGVPIVK